MTLSVNALSHALGIEANTLRSWISVAEPLYELGYKDGGRRLFGFHDAYILGVLSGISHTGMQVSPGIISDVIAHIVIDGKVTRPRAGEVLEVRESDSARLTLFLDKASDLIIEKLNASQGVAA